MGHFLFIIEEQMILKASNLAKGNSINNALEIGFEEGDGQDCWRFWDKI
jgi:hypothetical protein